MIDAALRAVPPLIGAFLAAAMLFLLAIPLLAGLLMAFKLVRYREWLAILAVLASMALLAGSGDYLYNLTYWTSSRFPPAMNVALCALTFGTPPFLFILVLTRSRRRRLWGLDIILVTAFSLVTMRNEFVTRKERDAEAYRQALKPLSPRTGVSLVRWGLDDYRSRPGKIFLDGHIPEATRVVLLADPFSRSFQPQFCTGVAAAYQPPVKDPAGFGNVTEVADLKGCSKRLTRGVAVLERAVTIYRAVSFQPYAGAPDPRVLANPVVRQAFEKLGYDPANFDAAKGELSQAGGTLNTVLYLTALQPIHTPPNAFPCTDPALLISVQDPGNVKAVLPYCAVNWNLFQLDNEFYFAATTQQPTPPGELVMNPEQTNWLFRVDGTELKQIWPSF